jgi:hypothetical protein
VIGAAHRSLLRPEKPSFVDVASGLETTRNGVPRAYTTKAYRLLRSRAKNAAAEFTSAIPVDPAPAFGSNYDTSLMQISSAGGELR